MELGSVVYSPCVQGSCPGCLDPSHPPLGAAFVSSVLGFSGLTGEEGFTGKKVDLP